MRVPIAIFWWGVIGLTAKPAFEFLSGAFHALAS